MSSPRPAPLPGVRLYDLDDLQQLRCPASGFARRAITEARADAGARDRAAARALDARGAAPRLAELHRAAPRSLMEEESERALGELGESVGGGAAGGAGDGGAAGAAGALSGEPGVTGRGCHGAAAGTLQSVPADGHFTQGLISPATRGLSTSPTGFSTFRHCGFTHPGQ